MRRVAAGVVLMLVALGAAAWILAPAEPEPLEPPAKRRLKQRLAQLEQLEVSDPKPRVRIRRASRESPRPSRGTEATPFAKLDRSELGARTFSGGPSVQEQVRKVLDAPIEPVPGIDDPVLARNRGYWKHNQRLDRLEGTLLTRLKNDPDPYEKFEVQVALAEVYQARVGALEQFEPSEDWGDHRTDRWLSKIDEEILVAQDKARMLLEISQREADRWPEDDPSVMRLKDLH